MTKTPPRPKRGSKAARKLVTAVERIIPLAKAAEQALKDLRKPSRRKGARDDQ